ncbi:MAG: universal stress protein [Peptococcaceae bacterium]|nr:universal stress protein [Peptococcaceae bacterium]
MYRKILVPFDNSSQALAAAQHALKLALVSRAAVTLLHVVQDVPVFSDERTEDRIGIDRDAIIQDAKRKAQAVLDKLKESLSDYEVKMDTAVVVGNPAREICKKAQIEGYDVIVMGSRGLGKIPGLLMGSVSNRVCRNASCPVIVIHTN